MNFRNLAQKNIIYFVRYYKLVAIAVLISIAVIVGSLVIGDSVRTTLIKRVNERLGNTETIIFSKNSFISEDLARTPLLGGSARGILLTNGFISHGSKLIPVYVWGVEDMSVPKGGAKINQALGKELGHGAPGAIVLRLPAKGLVPSGSLFVTDNYTTGMRLSFEGTVDPNAGGNISMKNEQIVPFNIFVNREELAETMETEGKINLILADKKISVGDLEKVWDYSSSGLLVNQREGFTEITSDRVFLPEKVVETIMQNNLKPNRLFSYLANSITMGEKVVPYSFVTALDHYKNEPLQKDEIILSDYSAKRLQAKPGDRVWITYFTSQDLKTLKTDSVLLKVRKIVPLTELQDDSTLSTNFPGISDVERCTEWDSDLPINMDLITNEDEKYWELYRTTPKAIIAYDAIAGDWSNAYGCATAIRVKGMDPDLMKLQADMFGIQLIYPRGAGLYAAKNGVNFSGLFLALGFFIIISAMLLLLIPLSEMLYQRRHEIALLKALGYPLKRITKVLWTESAPVVLISSIIGVVAGLLYTGLIIWLLGNLWKGATHTDGFSVYLNIVTICIGLLVGTGLSLWLLRKAIVGYLKEKHKDIGKKAHSLKEKKILVIVSSVLAIAVISINFFFLHAVMLFVIVGSVSIGISALWGDYLICRNGSVPSNGFSPDKMAWRALFANKKRALLSFFTLAIGVFIVFSVGLNRKGFSDGSQIQTGTGGYSLWCESSIPIYYNMATPQGREKLNLRELPGNTEILQCLRYNADEASCLNLNKVSAPTVLGVDMKDLSASHFRIKQNLYSSDRESTFKQMQVRKGPVYPALVDATVLMWSLGMNLGDTLYYKGDNGQSVAIQLIGTLSNSVFQGHILIDRNLFSEIWKETTGSDVFLLKVGETEKEKVRDLLSNALNEYGVKVSTTNDRLKQFNSVTDTYLTIFMTLGGLGLLLGIVGFIIVIRKNLSMRQKEIDLFLTLGFTENKIKQILYKENIPVPLYAIATGVISSLVAVSAGFMNVGIWIWFMALMFTIFFVSCIIVFVKRLVKHEIQNTKNKESTPGNWRMAFKE